MLIVYIDLTFNKAVQVESQHVPNAGDRAGVWEHTPVIDCVVHHPCNELLKLGDKDTKPAALVYCK